jgi:HPt (histidine-containing phosphotransfer) domain-containing protein
MTGDRERCLEAGMDDYLAKPVRAEELNQAIQRVASPKPAAAPVPPPILSAASSSLDPDQESALLARFGDRKFLRTMTRLFQTDAAKSLLHIREALDRQDPEALRVAAHALKGSAANFLAKSAVDAAYHLELMGRNQTLHDSEDGYRRLEAEIAALIQSLNAIGRTKKK